MVVNDPVLGVELPIGELLTLPPVTTALAELKFVATSVPIMPLVTFAVVTFTTAAPTVVAFNFLLRFQLSSAFK